MNATAIKKMKHAIPILDIHSDTQFIGMVVPEGKCSFFTEEIELKKPIYAGFFLKFLADQRHCIVLFLCREDLKNLKSIMVSNGLLLSTPFYQLENDVEGLDHVILGVPEIFRAISTFDLKNDLKNIEINDGTFPIWKDEWCFSSNKLGNFSNFKEIDERLKDKSIVMTKFRYDFDSYMSGYVLHNNMFHFPAMSTRFWIDRRVTEAYNPDDLEKRQQKICQFIKNLYYSFDVVAYTVHDQHGVIVFVSHEAYGIFTPDTFSKFLSELPLIEIQKLKELFADTTYDFNFDKWFEVYKSFDKEAYENGRWHIPLNVKYTSNPISSMRKVTNPDLENDEKMLTLSNVPESFKISITTYNLLRNGFESHFSHIDRTSKRLKNWLKRSIYIRSALKKANSDIFCLQEIDGEHGMLSTLDLKNSLPKHQYVISKVGKSGGKPCQCAIVYDATKFTLKESKELSNNFRFIITRFLHTESNKIFCIVSVDCKQGQNESKEAIRVKQLEKLLQLFESSNDTDVYLICGSFYSDPQIASRTHGKYTFQNKVHSQMESNGFENISGHDITYHGWSPCTFDYIYFKSSPRSNLLMKQVERSIDSEKATIPLPNENKKQGSDHIPVTVKVGFGEK